MKTFYAALANSALATIANYTAWFALTFFVYLETRSVFATGMISGVYLTLTLGSGFWFGSLVDHYGKKSVMLLSSALSLACYAGALALYLAAPQGTFADVDDLRLWVLILILLVGVVVGNLRSIALPTLVTALVPEERRANANGLSGLVNGLGFGAVSVISAFLVSYADLYGVLLFALALTGLAIAHLLTLRGLPAASTDGHDIPKRIDIRGTLVVLRNIPGMIPLILFTTFNNFLGGVFMALMDAYGLSLLSVEGWGTLLGLLSFSFMIGGAIVARFGLGARPLRTMLLANVFVWVVCIFFTLQASVALLAIGMFFWMVTGPVIEAAEQTVIQAVTPAERQGRVFGFAQSVEQAASPVTAFLMGPLAQFAFIPFMTTGAGVGLIGGWFGTGPDRGIALVFTLAGVIGVFVTVLALNSPYYRRLASAYKSAKTSA